MSFSDRKRARNLGLLGAAVVLLGAGCYALYQSFQQDEDDNSNKKIMNKYTSKPVTIILTDSIIAANLPINEILALTDDLVFVIPPNLSRDDLNETIDGTIDYKIIECETFQGIWAIVKHLQSEVIFVVKDDLEEDIPQNLERYVGEIVELEQNFSYINQKILSYIMN